MAVKGATSGQMAGIDPKILGLLGIQDNKDIDLGTYKTLLKEKMVAGRMTDSKMSTEDTEALTNAWKNTKGVNISGKSVASKVTDRKPPSAAKISPQKLLPGAGGSLQKVDQEDDKGVEDNKAEISQIKSFLEGPLGSGLSKIEENLQGVLSALTASNRADKRDARKAHVAQTKTEKRGREGQLESKAADLGKGILEKATKPVKGLFEMFWDFIKNVLLGGAILRLMKIIENPMRLLDPLFKVINGIIDFLNWLISSVVNLLTMPFNWIIKGINSGVGFLVSGVNNALSLIPGVGESVIPDLKIPEIPQMEGIIPKIPLADEKSPPVQGAEGGGTVVNGGDTTNSLNILSAEGGGPVVQQASGGAKSLAGFAGGGRIAGQAGKAAAGKFASPSLKVDSKKISAKKGGAVTGGSGIKITGMGKDTQLLAAQPGEVVMSKKAVDKIGADKLLAMNKAGGGDNKPRFSNNIQAASGGGLVGGSPGSPRDPKNRKIFLHWSAGGHGSDAGPYHQLFRSSGAPRSTNVNYGADLSEHTGGHNTDSVGLGVAAMLESPGAGHLGYTDWPTGPQINALVNEAASLASAWGWTSGDVDKNVMTHGEWERHAVKNGILPPDVQRWDLDMLKDGPVTHPGGHFSTQKVYSKGGSQLRSKIKSMMGSPGTGAGPTQTPESGGGAPPVIGKGTSSPQSSPPGPPGSSGGTNVSVIPGGGQQAGGQQSSGTAADQKVPPTFSPRDGNNPMLVAVTSIYNILGI